MFWLLVFSNLYRFGNSALKLESNTCYKSKKELEMAVLLRL